MANLNTRVAVVTVRLALLTFGREILVTPGMPGWLAAVLVLVLAWLWCDAGKSANAT